MATARQTMRERIKEQAKNATTEGASYLNISKKVTYFNPKDGDFELDFIPYEDANGDLQPFRRYKLHGGIGAEDNKYVCRTTIGERCPICEERKKMSRSKDSDSDIIKALNPKERILMQVIDLLDKKDDSVQLWDASYHAFAKDLLKAIDTAENSSSSRKRSLPHAGFAELEGGQTILLKMEESAKIKKFYQAVRIDAADRENYGEEILDEVLNLDECLKILDYDTLEKIFLELDPEDQGSNRKRDDKEEKKEEPAGRTRGRGAAAESTEEPSSRSRTRGGAKETTPEEPVTTTRTRGRGAASEAALEESTGRTRGKAAEAPAEETRSSRRGRTEAPPEEPVTTTRRGRGAPKEEPEFTCWVEDGVFGTDCDTHLGDPGTPNCYDCPKECWDACKAAQDAMKK